MKTSDEIDGWFNFQKTYDFLLSTISNQGIFVECGAWLGKSSAYLCDKAKNDISIFIVDSWLGSNDEINSNHQLAQNQDIYTIFKQNMGNRKFTTIKGFSIEASQSFTDNSCDVVFIDMEHTYDSVSMDIDTWLPKVKKNGYLAGHDYHHDWPGVIRAVDEKLGKENIITMDTCWIYHNNV